MITFISVILPSNKSQNLHRNNLIELCNIPRTVKELLVINVFHKWETWWFGDSLLLSQPIMVIGFSLCSGPQQPWGPMVLSATNFQPFLFISVFAISVINLFPEKILYGYMYVGVYVHVYMCTHICMYVYIHAHAFILSDSKSLSVNACQMTKAVHVVIILNYSVSDTWGKKRFMGSIGIRGHEHKLVFYAHFHQNSYLDVFG